MNEIMKMQNTISSRPPPPKIGQETGPGQNIRIEKLSAYEEIFPLAIKTLKLLYCCKKGNHEYFWLIGRANDSTVSILTALADGYNKFHAEDKVVLYSAARSNVSHVQSLLLILISLGIVPENTGREIVSGYDNKLKIFNGLIRKMEDKA